MAALGWLLNLGFSGGGIPAQKPATTAGGGRGERTKRPIRFSRAMSYFEPIRQEKKKHEQEVRQVIEQKAKDLAKQESIEIDQARSKARNALLLEHAVQRTKITAERLQSAIQNKEILQAIEKRKQDEESAILAILMATESYEA